MIEKEKLRYWAVQLEQEIKANKNASVSAAALYKMPNLLNVVEEAKALKIKQPIEHLIDYSLLYKCADFGQFKLKNLFEALSYFHTLTQGLPLIEKDKLKYWALELESEISKQQLMSSAARYLRNSEFVLEAIEDAKNFKIDLPSEQLGSSRPLHEDTDLHKFKNLSNAFSCFSLLLRGLRLPDDPPKVDAS